MDARAITSALNGTWQGSYGLCRCPVHADSNPSLKISDSSARGIDVHCFAGCDWKAVKDELKRQGLLNGSFVVDFQVRPRVVVQEEPKPIDWQLWHKAVPIPGTLGEQYYTQHRKLPVGRLRLEHAVRFHPVHRMVVALMTDAVTNEPVGLHRTFLDHNAKKKERKMLGHQGVVRIGGDANGELAIAEGVEDAIAITLDWGPCWAATSASAIKKFPVIENVGRLSIFADADAVGTKAAQECADRWLNAGRAACVIKL
jgi:hypothetical protein